MSKHSRAARLDRRCSCGDSLRSSERLCQACVKRLLQLLGDVHALLDDLDVMLTRQSRTGSSRNVGVTSRSSEKPLVWDDRASKARGKLHDALQVGVEILEPHHGDQAPADPRHRATWLMRHIGCLAHLDGADRLADRMRAAQVHVRVAIDRRPDLLYVGPCYEPISADETDLCQAQLYVIAGRDSVTCPVCGTVHDLDSRRAWLLAEVEDQLLHAAWISRALSGLGEPVTQGQISGWVFRKRLLPRGLDLEGRPTYRVGDVIDLLAEDAARAEAAAEKRRQAEEKRRKAAETREAS